MHANVYKCNDLQPDIFTQMVFFHAMPHLHHHRFHVQTVPMHYIVYSMRRSRISLHLRYAVSVQFRRRHALRHTMISRMRTCAGRACIHRVVKARRGRPAIVTPVPTVPVSAAICAIVERRAPLLASTPDKECRDDGKDHDDQSDADTDACGRTA